MADQGTSNQIGALAVPLAAKTSATTGHHRTESDFWADEAAPAIGGVYGIPNALVAAAAGSPGELPRLARYSAVTALLQDARNLVKRCSHDPTDVASAMVSAGLWVDLARSGSADTQSPSG